MVKKQVGKQGDLREDAEGQEMQCEGVLGRTVLCCVDRGRLSQGGPGAEAPGPGQAGPVGPGWRGSVIGNTGRGEPGLGPSRALETSVSGHPVVKAPFYSECLPPPRALSCPSCPYKDLGDDDIGPPGCSEPLGSSGSLPRWGAACSGSRG